MRKCVVVGGGQRNLEVAPLLGAIDQPSELVAAKNPQLEVRRIALTDVLDDVDVEVLVALRFLDLPQLEQEES